MSIDQPQKNEGELKKETILGIETGIEKAISRLLEIKAIANPNDEERMEIDDLEDKIKELQQKKDRTLNTPELIEIPEDKAIKIVGSLKVGDSFTSFHVNKNNINYDYKVIEIPAVNENGEDANYKLSYIDTNGEEKEHNVPKKYMIEDFMRGATLKTPTDSGVSENLPAAPEAKDATPVNSTENTTEEKVNAAIEEIEKLKTEIGVELETLKNLPWAKTLVENIEKELEAVKGEEERLKEQLKNPDLSADEELVYVSTLQDKYKKLLEDIKSKKNEGQNAQEAIEREERFKNLEKNLDEARTKYAEEYKAFLASANKFTKAKRLIFGAKFKDKELPQELKDLEKEYEMATVAFGQEMYKTKEGELNKSILPENERKAQLNAFKQNEIFTEIIVKEQIKLNVLKAENLPPKEKNIARKGMEWYMKQPRGVKIAISTAIGTAAFASFSGLGVSGVASYAGIRFARSILGALAGQGANKIFDKIKKEKSADERKKEEEKLAELFKEEDFEKSFAENKKEYTEILERERRAKRNRLITKAVIGLAAGGLVSVGTGYGINQIMHGTPDGINTTGGKENIKTGSDTELKIHHDTNVKLREEYLKKVGVEKELEKVKTDLKEAKEVLRETKNSPTNESSAPEQSSSTANNTIPQEKVVEEKVFNLENSAVVHKGEGIERVLIRQMDENPKLAQQLGFKGDINDKTALHKFAGQEAHRIALEKGYVDSATGKEIWIKDANKVAFELKSDANGKPIVTLRTIDGKVSEMEYKEEGYKFGKTPNDEYEYEHQRTSVPNKNTAVIKPNSAETHTIGLKEETFPTREERLNPGTAENVYAPEKHSLGIGEENSFFAEKIEKIKNIKEQIEANIEAENTKTNIEKIPRRQHWETEQVPHHSATEIYNHDIRHIFLNSEGGAWEKVRSLKTNNFIHDNHYNDEGYNNLKDYINELIKTTGKKPKSGFLGLFPETNEKYIKRAIKYAVEHNIKI